MTRKRTKARRHNLTLKQRRAKEAAKPQPETYTPEEAEAMRVELKHRLDRRAKAMKEGKIPRYYRGDGTRVGPGEHACDSCATKTFEPAR